MSARSIMAAADPLQGMGLGELLVIGIALFGLVTIVLVIPLFYTFVTRWAFSGGSPVPEAPAGRRALPAAVPAPVPAPPAADLGAREGSRPTTVPARGPAPDGARHDDRLGLVYDRRPENADDLTRIKGVASVIEGKLHGLGVYTYRQIALWSDDAVRSFSELLAFRDRIKRDDWRGQCRELHREKYGEDF